MPEQLRGDGGALGEAFQLRPHDRTVYAAGERLGPRLVRHCDYQSLRSLGAQGRTLHHRGIRFDLRPAARLDREPRPVRKYRYRCGGDPAQNVARLCRGNRIARKRGRG